MTPLLRPARLDDAAAISEFTTDTFAWGDYVAEEFPGWLDDPLTAVVVASDDREGAVGLARVRMLSPKEGWISAARVHPDHRRRGIASALNRWCVDWIADSGGAVARLQIETWNEAARRQVEGLGYRAVARVMNASRSVSMTEIRPVTNGGRRSPGDERLDRGPRAESEPAFIAWSASELSRAGRGMFAVEPWAWRRLAVEDVDGSSVWSCPSGWVMADEGDDQLTVRWLVCTPDDGDRLVRATVDLAHEKDLQRVHIAAPHVPWLDEAMTNNGFEIHHSHLFERAL